MFSFGGQSSLKRAFEDEGLDPEVVFTARDADVIKTYVRMGMGVGIVASMAADCANEKDLQVLDRGVRGASHPFWKPIQIKPLAPNADSNWLGENAKLREFLEPPESRQHFDIWQFQGARTGFRPSH